MFLRLLKIINGFLTKQENPSILENHTSEKIIMNQPIEPVLMVRNWSIDRIHFLAESKNVEDQINAISIAEEFDEWISIPDGTHELNCLVIDTE